MAENETLTQGKGERTGIFTTGIVARGLDATLAPIILYASGRRHAGENMDRLLNQRTVQESDVIHMADVVFWQLAHRSIWRSYTVAWIGG